MSEEFAPMPFGNTEPLPEDPAGPVVVVDGGRGRYRVASDTDAEKFLASYRRQNPDDDTAHIEPPT